jgi:hypothetical protein
VKFLEKNLKNGKILKKGPGGLVHCVAQYMHLNCVAAEQMP